MGQHGTMVSRLASGPSCPRFDSQHSQKEFQKKIIVNVAEVNQWPCIEESGQWLQNVDQTSVTLASGKLVLKKYYALQHGC